MLTLITRCVGVVVVLGLAAVGADTILYQIMAWKNSYDDQMKRTRTHTTMHQAN